MANSPPRRRHEPTVEMVAASSPPAPSAATRRLRLVVMVASIGIAVVAVRSLVRTALYADAIDRVRAQSLLDNDQAKSLLQQAIGWRPDLAEGPRILANRLFQDDEPAAMRAARRAIALDGSDWQNWQTLALLQLQQGDVDGARQSLGIALHFNQGFESHYALGNLALITGDVERGRQELFAALGMATAEGVGPVLRELLQAGTPATELAARLAASPTLVQVHAILAFVADHQLPGGVELFQAMRCAPFSREACQWAAHALVSTLAQSAESASGPASQSYMLEAQQVWNRAIAQSILMDHFAARPEAVANGDFRSGWTNQPLNWTGGACTNMGIGLAPDDATTALVLRFDGAEGEACELAQQWVLVRPGQEYQVSYRARADRGDASDGLSLQVGMATPRVLANLPVHLRGDWTTIAGRFLVPAGSYLIKLAFVFQRPAGEPRINAPVWVADVRLGRLSP